MTSTDCVQFADTSNKKRKAEEDARDVSDIDSDDERLEVDMSCNVVRGKINRLIQSGIGVYLLQDHGTDTDRADFQAR